MFRVLKREVEDRLRVANFERQNQEAESTKEKEERGGEHFDNKQAKKQRLPQEERTKRTQAGREVRV